MAWRLAKSLEKLRSQVNEKFPRRDKSADGSIGDAAHATRNSDHNPWVDGNVVTAIDITHDPKSGCDAGRLADALRASRDPRIKYIISNGRICSGDTGYKPWVWRPYDGKNAHRHHMHLSVKADKRLYDSPVFWSAVDMLQFEPAAYDGHVQPSPSAEPAEPPVPLWKRAWTWASGGGIGMMGAGIYDWRVAVALGAVAVVVFLVVWFTFLRKRLERDT